MSLQSFFLTIEQTYTGGRVIPDLWIGRDLERTAVTIVQKIHGLADGDVVYNSGYSTDTADYAYLTQSHVCVPYNSQSMISSPNRMASCSSMPLRT